MASITLELFYVKIMTIFKMAILKQQLALRMKKILSILAMSLFSVILLSQGLPINESTFSGFQLRNVGPAFTSGRIADVAIHPDNQNIWYVAVGSGGVWKTENSGTTWTPIFDDQPVYFYGVYSIRSSEPKCSMVRYR